MIVTEETKQVLRHLGLTSYEIAAYLFLLSTSPLTAEQVSKGAKLPYSKIYDVLTSLQAKGWLQVEDARPKRYSPKPPSDALEATLLNMESSLFSGIAKARSELEPMYVSKELQERPDIRIVRGTLNILVHVQETLNQSRSELMIATASPPLALVELLLKSLRRLKETGVKISLIITEDVGSEILKSLFQFGEVRVKERMFGGGIVSDGRKVMLFLGSSRTGDYLAIFSDHLGLANLAKEYFQYLWKEAQQLQ